MKRFLRLVAWLLVLALAITILVIAFRIPPMMADYTQLSLSLALFNLWKYFLAILVCVALIALLVLILNKTRMTAEQEKQRKDREALKQLTRKGR